MGQGVCYPGPGFCSNDILYEQEAKMKLEHIYAIVRIRSLFHEVTVIVDGPSEKEMFDQYHCIYQQLLAHDLYKKFVQIVKD